MACINEYLDWRGDIPLRVSPFNEVDNYIVAKIGTADYTGLVSRDAVSLPIGVVVEDYFARYGEEGNYFGALASPSIGPTIRRLPKTERFRELRLSGFVNKVLPEITEQFSALTLTLPDGTHYISFRGTDDTIAAWKENFMMSLDGTVPAQRDAADYLAWAAAHYSGPLRVGGHSKGGNLAVFSAATAEPAVQERILAVYNNDGPGFDETFLRSEGYLRIRDKVITLLPQYSIVGTLLCQEDDDRITVVKSTKAGVAAHDGFNWETVAGGFVHCDGLSRSSRALDSALEEMLRRMNVEERRQFIDEFFNLLTESGAVTLTDINENKLRRALDFGKGLRREKRVQRFAVDAMEMLVKEYASLTAEQVREWRTQKKL